MNFYESIISNENILKAYLEVVRDFDLENKSNKYFGYDGKKINDYNTSSKKLIKEIEKDLIDFKKNEPALKIFIPKKNKPGLREVYLHNVKEKIKSQSIYQIIEPVIDKKLSKYLFSYRKTHPYYKVIKLVAKQSKKSSDQDFVLVGDISKYSDNIDKEILLEKIKELGFDEKTEKLIENNIDTEYIEDGILKKKEEGFITGLPVTVLFNNLYLDEMDKKIGGKAFIYRRVGDDFIVFDSYEKLIGIKKEIEDILENLKIKKEVQKINILKCSEGFVFLGHHFNKQIISIPDFSFNNIKIIIRKTLKYYPVSLKQKIKNLKKILYGEKTTVKFLIEFLKQYNYVNNDTQIKLLSDYFFIRLTIYFFNKYSKRNHRRTIEITKKMNIPSIFKYYIDVHNGKTTFNALKAKSDIIRKNERF